MSFYDQTMRKLMDKGELSPTDTVLVVCGGTFDVDSLKAAGIEKAVISNLDTQYAGYCEPYEWAYLDAEALDLPDGSYDWVFEHAGLHHCGSPHLALLEMYRVARKGVLAVEARDSFVMRTAIRYGFTPDYELEAVALNPERLGGLRHTGTPNFIYRWREGEVRKTIESAHPDRVNDIEFFYGIALPLGRMSMVSPVRKAAAKIAAFAAKAAFAVLPRQGNQFAFAVYKRATLKPWIKTTEEGNVLDPDYNLSFDPAKYKPASRDER